MSQLARLRQLIGHSFDYQSAQWRLVEVLIDDGHVVLQRVSTGSNNKAVQSNQFGQAQRRVEETLCLPISAPDDSDNYSDELLTLLQGKRP